MKRVGNLYEKICAIKNLELADKIACRGKAKQPGVIEHKKNRGSNILKLNKSLVERTYRTSEYYTFILNEGKEREISRLPYYPDRIVHHAVMNILEPIFVRTFTADTYSCVKKRGIHKALRNLTIALEDKENTTYCLKMDIRKFYPNVDNAILKTLIRRKFKDEKLLVLLDEIIDSKRGLPIGNLLSQYLANFYLTYFDHWLKEEKQIKYYFRYMDDIVILNSSKENLHQLCIDITRYVKENLNLEIKSNYQVFPVEVRGIDFVGYSSYHTHIKLRTGIKKRFVKMTRDNYNKKSLASYHGWIIHSNGRHLMKTHLKSNQDFTK